MHFCFQFGRWHNCVLRLYVSHNGSIQIYRVESGYTQFLSCLRVAYDLPSLRFCGKIDDLPGCLAVPADFASRRIYLELVDGQRFSRLRVCDYIARHALKVYA